MPYIEPLKSYGIFPAEVLNLAPAEVDLSARLARAKTLPSGKAGQVNDLATWVNQQAQIALSSLEEARAELDPAWYARLEAGARALIDRTSFDTPRPELESRAEKALALAAILGLRVGEREARARLLGAKSGLGLERWRPIEQRLDGIRRYWQAGVKQRPTDNVEGMFREVLIELPAAIDRERARGSDAGVLADTATQPIRDAADAARQVGQGVSTALIVGAGALGVAAVLAIIVYASRGGSRRR
jgi:hypothetical protein